MIQGQPSQNVTPPPNKRLKGLIIGAQIFSVFAFLGILVIFSWTVKQVTRRNRNQQQSEITNDIPPPVLMDTTASSPDVPINSPSNSPSDKTLLSEAEIQCNVNVSLYEMIKINTPDTTYNKSEIISSLMVLRNESNTMTMRLENLYQTFKDTLNKNGVSDIPNTTQSFFANSKRDQKLKDQLKAYREEVINTMLNLNFGYVDELRTSMPLDDTNSSGYVVEWNDGKFYGDPSDALTYLRELEVEVRNFEAAALNKYPQTITH
ncbi:MAG TPA: hypothetical protein VFJ43_02470 [Bacteroidia bacterium]|nr:hypothetical protein [Bacteroidia bacterium]